MINDISNYKRIIVIGCPGSGKSYFACRLADTLFYPLLHLDKIFWLPNWDKVRYEVFLDEQREFMTKEKWIIDGNYSRSLKPRFAKADLVIFLDINRLTCIFSAIRRVFNKRDGLPEYLDDKLDFEFLKYIWGFSKKHRPLILDLHNQYNETAFITISSRRQLRELIERAVSTTSN